MIGRPSVPRVRTTAPELPAATRSARVTSWPALFGLVDKSVHDAGRHHPGRRRAAICGDCRRSSPPPIRAPAARTGAVRRAGAPGSSTGAAVRERRSARSAGNRRAESAALPGTAPSRARRERSSLVLDLMPEIYRLASFSSMSGSCGRASYIPAIRAAASRTTHPASTGQERTRAMMNRRQVIAAGAGGMRPPGRSLGIERAAAQLAGNAFIVSGFPAGGMGDLLSPPAGRKAARQLRGQRPGRQPRRRRRTDRRGIRQARQPGRADHPADPGVDHDAVSAHLQNAELRSARRLHSGDASLCTYMYSFTASAGSAGGDPDRRRFRRLGARQPEASRPTAFRRRARRCISPA